jgi:hypothetical protein
MALERGRVGAVLLLFFISVLTSVSGTGPAGAERAPEATTEAFAAAAEASPEASEEIVEPQAIPGIVAAARAATFGAQQLARTTAFRQQLAAATRQAGLFRQVAGLFGFGASVPASASDVPNDVERIFDD